MSRSSTITVKLTGDNKDLNRAFADSEDRASKFGSNVGKFVALGAAAIAVGVGAIAVASVNQASLLAESANAVNVTFGDQAAGITALAEAAANGVGLSTSEFNGLAVQFAGFAKSIAGEGGDVVGTIDDITKRASDFASVMNLDVADSAALFQSALAGETEGMRKYGVDLSAAAVETYALSDSTINMADGFSEAEKVQARYGLLMRETEKVQGDFANTSDGFANVQRRLGATVKNLAAKFGMALLPILEQVGAFVADTIVPFFEKHLPAAIDFTQLAIGTIVAFIQQHWGTISSVFSTSLAAIRSVVDFVMGNQPVLIGLLAAIAVGLAVWAAGAVIAAASTALAIAPFLLAGIAIAAIVAALVYAYQNFETFRTIVDTVRAWMVDVLWPAIQQVIQGIIDVFTNLVTWTQTHWAEIQAVIDNVLKFIQGVIEAFISVAQALWNTFGNEILAAVELAFNTIQGIIQTVLGVIQGVIQTVTAAIRGDWDGVWNGIKETLSIIWEGIKGIVSSAIEAVKILLSGAWSAIEGAIPAAWELVKTAISTAWDGIKTVVTDAVDEIVGFVTGLPTKLAEFAGDMLDAGKDLGKGFLDGLKEGITGAVGFASDLATKMISSIKSGLNTAINAINAAIPNKLGVGVFSVDIPDNPIPTFHGGGIVPGSSRQEVPIMAQGGEGVFTEDQMDVLGRGRGSGPLIAMNGPVTIQDATDVELVAQTILARLAVA